MWCMSTTIHVLLHQALIGPSRWYLKHSQCKGERQSPVDFHSRDPVRSSTLKKLRLSPGYSKSTSGHLINNGHTVKFSIDDENEIEFWENEKTYQALQLHFHWGTAAVEGKSVTYSGGSEHTVNGKHYPIEMHIVHKKLKEDGHPQDDLAVIGIFFDLASDENEISNQTISAFSAITNLFQSVPFSDQESKAVTNGPVLQDLIPSNGSYYRYMGSLTTPPCTESVLWTVFVNPVPISKDIFLSFQSLFKLQENDMAVLSSIDEATEATVKDHKNTADHLLILDNFRPAQPYNEREVHVYVDGYVYPATAKVDVLSIVLWTLLGLTVFVVVLAMMICCRKRQKKEDRKTIYAKVGTKGVDEEIV